MVILAQPKCVLMRAKRGERAACARTGYPTFSPPGGLSSRTHAELQLHCGRNGLLAVGFSSGSSALKICSILIIIDQPSCCCTDVLPSPAASILFQSRTRHIEQRNECRVHKGLRMYASERGSSFSAPASQLHRLSSLTLFVDLVVRGFAATVPMPPAQWLHSFDLFRSSSASATILDAVTLA